MRLNVYSSFVFTVVDLFALKFSLDMVIPRQPLMGRQKTSDTMLPGGEERILLHSLILTQYRSVMDR